MKWVMNTRVGVFTAVLFLLANDVNAQKQAYIGYCYPAGGKQGTTFKIKVGGQRLLGLYGAVISGKGVKARLIDYYRPLSPQDVRLLREQLKRLNKKGAEKNETAARIKARIQARISEWTTRPANAAISEIAFFEVAVAPDAEPGEREIRLLTSRGISNPLPFYVGTLPEHTRKPMALSKAQVLGKEWQALRNRPASEVEVGITLPCTLNGQIASGEFNRYRFSARKGQKLVITTLARQLVPYIADAVPGWFQSVLTLYDSNGKEVAFNDDFRFKPDPTLLYEVPQDGNYVLQINDAIYRGREDFVYRITIGEVPFITSVFPLGRRAGTRVRVKMNGWNLEDTLLKLPPQHVGEGIYTLRAGNKKMVSNPVPFMVSDLPEVFEQEDNNGLKQAQKVKLPVIINGRSNRPGDRDVFRIDGRGGETIVAEVYARRLDSPLDSLLELTDENGRVLAFNDDHCDPGSGLNTHHADSYLIAKLPADGIYYIHLTDNTFSGGAAYAYRLRISHPRPDFELRSIPSRFNLRSKSVGAVTVYALRKDGFEGAIKLRIRCNATNIRKPVPIVIEGYAKVGKREITRTVVGAEDYMQAFLWRHMVPAKQLLAFVYNTSVQLPSNRLPPRNVEDDIKLVARKNDSKEKKQIINRMKQLRRLYEDWYFTDEYYQMKIAEYKAAYEKF